MLYLDNASNNQNVDHGVVLNATVSVVTVCGWVDLDETASDSGIWDFGDGTHHFVAYYNNGLYLGVNYPAVYINTAFTNTSKLWLCFVDDGTNCKVYTDMTEALSSAYSTDIALGSQSFILGRYFATAYCMNGKAWDVRVYNRALDASERAMIFYGDGADNVVDGMVLRALYNDKPDATASANAAGECKDASGAGMTGTPVGTPTYYATPNRLIA